MRCGQRLGNLGAGAIAGVDQALRPQDLQRLGIGGGALRLDDRGAVMPEAEPFQILENAVDKLRTAAPGIKILDPQEEQPAALARLRMAKCRRISVTQVEPTRRRRGETCDLQDSLHDKGDIGDS